MLFVKPMSYLNRKIILLTMNTIFTRPSALNRIQRSLHFKVGLLLGTILIGGLSTEAATWNTNANNANWGTNGNWTTPATAPNAVGAVADFLGVITANRNVNINGNFTVGTINFNDNNSYNLRSVSRTRVLTMDVSSGSASINSLGGTGHAIGLGGNIEYVLGNNDLILNNTTANTTMTIAGGITGTGNLIKNGSGRVIYLKGPSSTTGYFTGNVTVNAGILQLGTINDGTVEIGNSTTVTLNNGGTLLYFGNNQINNTANLVMNGGTFSLNNFDQTFNNLNLSLSSNSTIDMGTGTGSVLNFTGTGTHALGSTLTISNWSGLLSGGGTDQIIFGTSLSAAFLSNVVWSTQGITGARQLKASRGLVNSHPVKSYLSQNLAAS